MPPYSLSYITQAASWSLSTDPAAKDVEAARTAYDALGDKKSDVDKSVVDTLEAAEQKVAEREADQALADAEIYKDDKAVSAGIEALKKAVNDGKTQDISKAAKEQQTTVNHINGIMENLKLTVEQAMDALSIPQSQRSTYAGLVGKQMR